jgi:PhzF family phenazine biosynthesis protein
LALIVPRLSRSHATCHSDCVSAPYFQIDAFSSSVFSGNPAGVCLLEKWLPDDLLQKIAAENNLSETAFVLAAPASQGEFELRWFTPTTEVDLCGHATLAAAFALFTELGFKGEVVSFRTRSGPLSAANREGVITLDFPAWRAESCPAPADLVEGLGWIPGEVYRAGSDYLAVIGSERDVRALDPKMAKLAALDCRGVIVTAPGGDCDFVSRFFAPQMGIPEDPVTGSAHSALIPYWSVRLGKPKLFARQLSRRGGEIYCEARGERVGIGGSAALYSRAQIEIG